LASPIRVRTKLSRARVIAPQRLGAVAVGHQQPEAVAVGASELGQHEAVKHIALASATLYRDRIALT
jgi:hypothetical protein